MSRKIVDEYEYENLVSRKNKVLVKDFLTEKKSQRKSPNTIKQYEYDMRILLTLILRHFENKNLTDLTRKDLRNLSIVLQERGISNARVNRQISCLRSCLEFAADDDDYEYEHNVGSRVKGLPKAPVREITFLTEEQIFWLRDQLLNRNETLKAMYLMISYISAARKNEVHQVTKHGLTERFLTNTVTGKRGKKFRLYYDNDVQRLVKQYLSERGEDAFPQLFVRVYKTGERRPLSVSTFNEWCEYFTSLLTIKEGKYIHVNPHCLRHSRLENLNRSGIPIEKLKTLANHTDISTTASYLAERTEEDIAEIFGMDASCFAV